MKILTGTVLFIIASIISLSDSQLFQQCSYYTSPTRLEATTTQTEFRIPNNGEDVYRSDQKCEWIITTKKENHVIRLLITNRQIEGPNIHGDCVSDYLDIFDVKDGYKVFKERYCGFESNEVSIQSSSSELVVQFISNRQYQFRGFQALYMSTSIDTNDNVVGLALGITSGILILISFLVIIVLLCRVRKRKELERAQRLVSRESGTQNDQALSPRSTSPPAYTTDLSPFVIVESRPTRLSVSGQDVALSTRSDEPPPAYDAIDAETPPGMGEAPPPSYDTVLRESANMAPSDENISYS